MIWNLAEQRPQTKLEDSIWNPEFNTVTPGFMNDSETLVGIAPGGKAVHHWNTETGRITKKASFRAKGVPEEFSPGGKYLMLWSGNPGEKRIVDTQTGRLLHTFSNDGGTGAFSPDGRYYVGRTRSGIIRVISLADGKIIKEIENKEHLNQLHFSPDSKSILWTNEDSEEGHSMSLSLWGFLGDITLDSVATISLSSTGVLVAKNAIANELKIYRATSGGPPIRVSLPQDSSMQLLPDGETMLLSIHGDNIYHLGLDLNTGKPKYELSPRSTDNRALPIRVSIGNKKVLYGDKIFPEESPNHKIWIPPSTPSISTLNYGIRIENALLFLTRDEKLAVIISDEGQRTVIVAPAGIVEITMDIVR